MSDSPETPAPLADVTSDHRFPAAAMIEHHQLTNAGPRRASYSLYHSHTHEPEVYPEFNWDNHSNVKLCDPAHQPRHRTQLDSTGTQSNLVSPSPPSFQTSPASFSHPTPHFTVNSYRTDGTVEETVHPDSSSVPSLVACVKVSPPSNTSTASPLSSVENQAPRRRGKLPSAVTGILRTWLMSHTAHPYPTEEEKKNLCEQTNLTMNQVSNWFINARRRILVPPSAGNSVHEVRHPVRRQTQSQLGRAASNARLASPYLTIRHLSPQSVQPSSTGLTLYSPLSASSPNLSSGGNFGFRSPFAHPTPHESPFHHGNNLNGCRSVSSLCSSPIPWHHTSSLIRQPPSSPLYPPQSSHGLSYYSSQSGYPSYDASNPSCSSTPLPSPIYSFAPYSANEGSLNSPRSHYTSHPSPSTLSHSSEHPHTAPAAYMTQASCNLSTNDPVTPDREE